MMMPVTVRLDDDVVAYFKERGRFGESYSDVLRRLLPEFRGTQELQTHEKNESQSSSSEDSSSTVFGYKPSNVVRSLGAMGWNEEEVRRLLVRLKIPLKPATVKTQIAWGRQWGKGNPACHDPKKPYGSEPPILTPEQLAELRRE